VKSTNYTLTPTLSLSREREFMDEFELIKYLR
jgi:hypothetical protein